MVQIISCLFVVSEIGLWATFVLVVLLFTEEGVIEIFPDGVIAGIADHFYDFGGGALVFDFELGEGIL